MAQAAQSGSVIEMPSTPVNGRHFAASLCIRDGQLKDAHALAVLATQVWLHTYATDGITAEIAAYVLDQLTPERYLAVLHDKASQILVAESGDHLIGFAALKFGAPCPMGCDSLAELQTLYVQEHFMRRGVGKALLHAAQDTARQRSHAALWLTVYAKNANAIAFCSSLGYTGVEQPISF